MNLLPTTLPPHQVSFIGRNDQIQLLGDAGVAQEALASIAHLPLVQQALLPVIDDQTQSLVLRAALAETLGRRRTSPGVIARLVTLLPELHANVMMLIPVARRLVEQGERATATAALQRIVVEKPHGYFDQMEAAHYLNSLGQRNVALHVFEAVARDAAVQDDVRVDAARMLLHLDAPAGAIALFLEVLPDLQAETCDRSDLASLLATHGHADAARQILLAVSAGQYDNSIVNTDDRIDAALALAALGDTEAADAALHELATSVDQDELLDLAGAWEERGQPAEAQRIYDRILAQPTRSPNLTLQVLTQLLYHATQDSEKVPLLGMVRTTLQDHAADDDIQVMALHLVLEYGDGEETMQLVEDAVRAELTHAAAGLDVRTLLGRLRQRLLAGGGSPLLPAGMVRITTLFHETNLTPDIRSLLADLLVLPVNRSDISTDLVRGILRDTTLDPSVRGHAAHAMLVRAADSEAQYFLVTQALAPSLPPTVRREAVKALAEAPPSVV